ncbi:MAG: hypothetical protein OHK0011_06150 [Turneriella sp.]
MRPFGFLLLATITPQLFAATVVTSNERIAGTITAKSKTSVTIKMEDGQERTIDRDRIVQIFDDNGELVYASPALMPDQKKAPEQGEQAQEKPLDNALIIDGLVGGIYGGFYNKERDFSDGSIRVEFSDGTTQYSKSTLTSFGFGLNYQKASSARWTTLYTYTFRSVIHSVYAGDDQKYKREDISTQMVSSRHALLIGKEARFYPTQGLSSIDIIGQVGYELGNYYPLATYNDYRTKLTPTPALYTGPGSVMIHGPTARIGSGISFRFSPAWQMRLLAFYQIAYSMASDQIWNAVEKNVLTHDLYGMVSFGYSF